jgi:protocatechuate 3,4-dioxygenase beta subunit
MIAEPVIMFRISFVIALVLAMAAPAQSAQQPAGGRAAGAGQGGPAGGQRPGLPPRDTSATAIGTSKIRGRVFAADTNAPLRRAQVTITAGQLGVRRLTTTDGDGRYEFADLADGRYIVTASKGGYVTLQYGQRRAFEPGRQVTLTPGQQVNDVDVTLPRGSVIAGRIADEFGEPIAGAQIEVQRYQYNNNGQRRLTFAGGSGLVLTDDRGEFRAYGLMPGDYIVSGTVRRPAFQSGSNPNDTTEGYAPTYYPGTPNPAEAQLVSLGLAQETSIQLTLQAVRLARVSGVAVDSEGRPLTNARVVVRYASIDGGRLNTGGTTRADGSFTLANVPPGSHVIDVVSRPRGPGAVPEAGSTPVSVSNEDVAGVRVTTARAATVRGTVVFEGSSARSGVSGGLRVAVQSIDDLGGERIGGFDNDAGRVAENGAFQVRGMGMVIFRAINLGPWMLKRVTLDGQDITDTPLDLTGGGTVDGLRVVLTDRATNVAGTASDERSRPVKEFVAVIQPVEERLPSTLQRYLRAARPDQDGRFAVRGLPPGDYVVTAIEALEQGGEWDPEYRSRLREAGRRIEISEGESIELDLKLTAGL